MVRVVLIRLHSKSVLLDIDIIPDGDSFLVVKGRWLLRVVVIRRKKGVGVVRKTRCKVVVCVCLLLWWWWSGVAPPPSPAFDIPHFLSFSTQIFVSLFGLCCVSSYFELSKFVAKLYYTLHYCAVLRFSVSVTSGHD